MVDRLCAGPTYGFTVDYQPSFPGAAFTSYTRALGLAIQPVASYAVTDWLSVGAGPVVELSHLETRSNLPFGAIDRVYDWNAGAGFVLGTWSCTATPSTVIGLTYRSEIDHDFSGSRTGFLNSPSSVEVDNPPLVDLGIRQAVLPCLRDGGGRDLARLVHRRRDVFIEPKIKVTMYSCLGTGMTARASRSGRITM